MLLVRIPESSRRRARARKKRDVWWRRERGKKRNFFAWDDDDAVLCCASWVCVGGRRFRFHWILVSIFCLLSQLFMLDWNKFLFLLSKLLYESFLALQPQPALKWKVETFLCHAPRINRNQPRAQQITTQHELNEKTGSKFPSPTQHFFLSFYFHLHLTMTDDMPSSVWALREISNFPCTQTHANVPIYRSSS